MLVSQAGRVHVPDSDMLGTLLHEGCSTEPTSWALNSGAFWKGQTGVSSHAFHARWSCAQDDPVTLPSS